MEEQFFLHEWCKQTTAAMQQIQTDVTQIRVKQEKQDGRIAALEKTERTARWAVGAATVAIVTVIGDFVKNHLWR